MQTNYKKLNNLSTKKNFAFTLAEVLITITIIGVVAAMTIPNLLTDINQKKYNSMSGNFQRKLGEALRVMNSQNTLRGHTSTMSFVNELGKNFKIVKVCDTVTECFPAKFKKSSGTVVDTSTLTDATSIGKTYGTETVGVEFVNGVRAIIAYNPNYTLQSNKDIVSFTKKNKTVQMNTDVISIIFDVSEDDSNTIGEDIFTFNTNLGTGTTACEHKQIGKYYCIEDLGPSESISCQFDDMNQEFCGESRSGSAWDYWAGAQKMCRNIGMELASKEDLEKLYALHNEGFEGADVIPSSGEYWSSTEHSKDFADILNFSGNGKSGFNAKTNHYNVLCVSN